MLFGEIDATGWALVVGAVFAGLTALVVQIINLIVGNYREQDKMRREDVAAARMEEIERSRKQREEYVAQKVDEVKDEAAHDREHQSEHMQISKEARDEVRKVHTLVNSAMAEQLRVASVALRRIADISGLKQDKESADDAEKRLADHIGQQKTLDAQNPGETT